VNRKTLEYKKSVHTPDYPEIEWIINPSVPSCPRAYWKVSADGKGVEEMSKSEKSSVDSAPVVLVDTRMTEICMSARAEAITQLKAERKIPAGYVEAVAAKEGDE
jgi:hypothetical protein